MTLHLFGEFEYMSEVSTTTNSVNIYLLTKGTDACIASEVPEAASYNHGNE